MKLIPIAERHPSMRCWFCRTNKSVKYMATMINVNPSPQDTRRYMNILVCNKCAVHHQYDFLEDIE